MNKLLAGLACVALLGGTGIACDRGLTSVQDTNSKTSEVQNFKVGEWTTKEDLTIKPTDEKSWESLIKAVQKIFLNGSINGIPVSLLNLDSHQFGIELLDVDKSFVYQPNDLTELQHTNQICVHYFAYDNNQASHSNQLSGEIFQIVNVKSLVDISQEWFASDQVVNQYQLSSIDDLKANILTKYIERVKQDLQITISSFDLDLYSITDEQGQPVGDHTDPHALHGHLNVAIRAQTTSALITGDTGIKTLPIELANLSTAPNSLKITSLNIIELPNDDQLSAALNQRLTDELINAGWWTGDATSLKQVVQITNDFQLAKLQGGSTTVTWTLESLDQKKVYGQPVTMQLQVQCYVDHTQEATGYQIQNDIVTLTNEAFLSSSDGSVKPIFAKTLTEYGKWVMPDVTTVGFLREDADHLAWSLEETLAADAKIITHQYATTLHTGESKTYNYTYLIDTDGNMSTSFTLTNHRALIPWVYQRVLWTVSVNAQGVGQAKYQISGEPQQTPYLMADYFS